VLPPQADSSNSSWMRAAVQQELMREQMQEQAVAQQFHHQQHQQHQQQYPSGGVGMLPPPGVDMSQQPLLNAQVCVVSVDIHRADRLANENTPVVLAVAAKVSDFLFFPGFLEGSASCCCCCCCCCCHSCCCSSCYSCCSGYCSRAFYPSPLCLPPVPCPSLAGHVFPAAGQRRQRRHRGFWRRRRVLPPSPHPAAPAGGGRGRRGLSVGAA